MKILEIRDSLTFIPMLAIEMSCGVAPPNAIHLVRRAGYSFSRLVLMTRLGGGGQCEYDPYAWGDRTFAVSHKYIIDHWDELQDGDVVDVEYILGETKAPKMPEWKESRQL